MFRQSPPVGEISDSGSTISNVLIQSNLRRDGALSQHAAHSGHHGMLRGTQRLRYGYLSTRQHCTATPHTHSCTGWREKARTDSLLSRQCISPHNSVQQLAKACLLALGPRDTFSRTNIPWFNCRVTGWCSNRLIPLLLAFCMLHRHSLDGCAV